jgi:hypothetical protein
MHQIELCFAFRDHRRGGLAGEPKERQCHMEARQKAAEEDIAIPRLAKMHHRVLRRQTKMLSTTSNMKH